jgi:uroporphyrinogen-III decarboxylase
VLIGNVNTSLFFSGTRNQMQQAIKDCLAIVSKQSGYVLASGCEVPGVAPPEKVDWFIELAKELGVSQGTS